MNKTSLIGINRLRFETDGHGITTLVAFHGCMLRCKYCLNPQCLNPLSGTLRITPQEVMNILKKDELYFLATGGGVTFGGGEPLLNSDYIKQILELGANKWHITVETSLNVPFKHLESLFPYIDEYIVDIKDMNSLIYKTYTGYNNDKVVDNLKWLINHGKKENIICRVPLIPNFNSSQDQISSVAYLRELGIHRFDCFDYVTNSNSIKL